MAVKISSVLNDQQFNSNGVMLSGGKIETYLAGSTTPATTFTSDAGTVSQPNPIILNTRGEVPNLIYLTTGIKYKFLLKDSANNLLRTYDNIEGVNDSASSIDQWINTSVSPTYINATQFSLAGDQTTNFTVNRRVKILVTAGTLYGYISASVFTTLTTVTVVLDSGVLDTGLTSVQIGLVTSTNTSIRVLTAQMAFDSGPLGFRNKIINGAMGISQRGSTFSNPAVNTYTLDRWLVSYDGTAGTFAVSQNNSANDASSQKELYWNQTVASSGNTYKNIQQRIEGASTLAGKQVTVSFTAANITNVSSVTVGVQQVFGSGGSPSASVNTSFGTVNLTGGIVKTQYSITATIPSVVGKTLGANGDDFLALFIALPINAVFGLTISNVQLEQGSTATPFETRSIGQELALCQRYYYNTNISGYLVQSYADSAGRTLTQSLNFPVTMRAVPTVTSIYSGSTNSTQVSITSYTNAVIAVLQGTGVGGFSATITWGAASAEL